MTYNFDPERWYEMQRRIVDTRRDRGELDDAAYQRELEALEQRYEDMLCRLDKPFEIPG